MTVIDKFFRAVPPAMTVARRAKLAGEFLAACVALDTEFSGTAGGWRITVAKVTDHREMVADDIEVPA